MRVVGQRQSAHSPDCAEARADCSVLTLDKVPLVLTVRRFHRCRSRIRLLSCPLLSDDRCPWSRLCRKPLRFIMAVHRQDRRHPCRGAETDPIVQILDTVKATLSRAQTSESLGTCTSSPGGISGICGVDRDRSSTRHAEFHSSAIKDVDHDSSWLALVNVWGTRAELFGD